MKRHLLLSVGILLLWANAWPTGAQAATPAYILAYSTSSDRSGGTVLNGASNLKGGLYIFTAAAGAPANFSPANVKQVTYTLDGKAWPNSEAVTPYDFNGGAAWDSSTVADGSHTIVQTVTTASGTTESDSATFTVQNSPPPPPAQSSASFACTPSFPSVTFSAFVPAGAKGYTFALTAGPAPLTITQIMAPTGFAMDPTPALPITIAAGDSQTFTVRFVPTAPGTYVGNIVFLANIPNGDFLMGVLATAN